MEASSLELIHNQRDFQDNFHIVKSKEAKFFPHDCIGLLSFKNNKKKLVGTAFLIASDLVLTVAHNIYCREEGQDFTDLKFYPGVSK
jgi:V8-like Glu-specific endopeptidase